MGEIPQEHVKAISVGSMGAAVFGLGQARDTSRAAETGRGSEGLRRKRFGFSYCGGTPAPASAPVRKTQRALLQAAVGDQVSHKTGQVLTLLAVQGDTIGKFAN